MPPKDKYTDPELRDEVKEEIHNGDKGGAPGQWSARKAQMMASEYKKRGGGYTTDKKDQDESQQHLSKWGEEDWQTKEGSANAKDSSGTQHRYLPKAAWENMTEQEKKETDDKKQAEGKDGKQFVGNTDKAKESRKQANEEEDEKFEKKKQEEKKEGDEKEEGEAKAGDKRTRDDEPASPAKKQKQNDGAAKETSSPSKKSQSKSDSKVDSESNGKTTKQDDTKDDSKSKDDAKDDSKSSNAKDESKSNDDSNPHGEPASTSRLPKENQEVYWKTLGNWTKGTVQEIAYEEKEVEGKKVKASEEDPRIVLKSESSGKVAVHKPEAVYF
ncbi:hypothetical protein E4T52_13738 [Aureobasidium sp. EXF-3400]|nr:hypothetical protein E4T51_11910 [Aureobasidium sp. EXF-12344]KAI4771267.1 hypothetical protein E4T52_13738 [Aureobasidium sp. EXF-3400]